MNKTLLIIGFVWPEPTSSAAGSRMMQLISFFKQEDFYIVFASACAKSEHAENLSDHGIEVINIELNNSSFDDFVKLLNPDYVLFDRFMIEEQFGWRIAEHCPNAIRILDTEDLHFLRKGREEAVKNNEKFEDKYLYNEYAKRELASIYRCDLSLIISLHELVLLRDDFYVNEEILEYIPFLFDRIKPKQEEELPSFEERKDFVTIGNFRHSPNMDAVLYLKHTIWPLINKSLPSAKLHIYGSYPTQQALELTNKKENFLVHVRTKDVNKVMKNARICLAPLRFGAGLKGKVFDGLKNGTPCIMTSIANEGIFESDELNDFVADEPEKFASEAVEHYINKDKWNDCQQSGFDLINTDFNKESYYKVLKLKLASIAQNIESHRQDNFMGQILQHHTMQSTKYLSKWIEEKNN